MRVVLAISVQIRAISVQADEARTEFLKNFFCLQVTYKVVKMF
jgi:hypothetical protein